MSQPQRSEKDIFFEIIDKATPQERARCLDSACGGDAALRRRVQDLLANHFEPDSFMKEPAVAAATADYSPAAEAPGTMVGRYKLLEKLGEGGFGAVYVAEQKEPVRRRLALKIIKLGMDTQQVVARFEAERQALALMDHPNIAKVLDGGLHEQRPFFVMELVKGCPLPTSAMPASSPPRSGWNCSCRSARPFNMPIRRASFTETSSPVTC